MPEEDLLTQESIQQLTRKVAKGGGLVVVGNFIGKGFTFLLQISLARVLGASKYGLYALGFSLIGLVRPFASLGLDTGIVRFGSLYKGEKNLPKMKGTFTSALLISLISSSLIGALLLIFSRLICVEIFSAPDLIPVLRIFAVSFPFYMLMLITASAARAFYAMQYYVGIINIFHPCTCVFFVVLALLLGFELNGVVCGFLVSVILSAVLGLYFLWKIFPEILSKIRASYEFKKLLRFSLPLFLAGIVWTLSGRIDRLMLGHFGLASNVGVYNAAAVVSRQSLFLVHISNVVFAPIVSDLHNKGGRREIEQLYKTITRWIFTISLPLVMILMFFSKELIELLFGVEFVRGWLVLVIFPAAYLLQACGAGPSGIILQMCGQQDIFLINAVIVVSINIVLNYWLIPIYGISGAAIATGISQALENLARPLQVKVFFGIHPFEKKMLRPVFSGGVGLLVAIFIKTWLGVVGLVTGLSIAVTSILVVYSLILYLFGLDEEDKIIIGALRKKLLRR